MRAEEARTLVGSGLASQHPRNVGRALDLLWLLPSHPQDDARILALLEPGVASDP